MPGVRRVVVWRTASGSPAPDPTAVEEEKALPMPLAALKVAADVVRPVRDGEETV